MYSYVIYMSLICTRMSSVCHSYLLACHAYVTRMYSYAIRMLFVCNRMSSVCHSYVLVCHPHVNCMCSYAIRMSLVCGFTINQLKGLIKVRFFDVTNMFHNCRSSCRKVFCKNEVLKVSQNWQESACVVVSFSKSSVL